MFDLRTFPNRFMMGKLTLGQTCLLVPNTVRVRTWFHLSSEIKYVPCIARTRRKEHLVFWPPKFMPC
jgi:hypothetical protein